MEQASWAINVDGLRTGYGSKEVLHDLDFSIPSGKWCILLGPNGSGKTTLMRTLMGMIIPFGGKASVLQMDCYEQRQEIKSRVGYVAEDPFLYAELSAIQHLRFAGDMQCVPKQDLKDRADRLLEFFELTNAKKARLSTYSLGMKRKVSLGMALIHKPRVLILDEPFNGLDPPTAKACRLLLRELCDRDGITIFMSTHNLGIMYDFYDRLLIINEGLILEDDSSSSIAERYPGRSLEDIFMGLIGESGQARTSIYNTKSKEEASSDV